MKELKIAIQKSGRLSENSKRLLEECGIKFSNGTGILKTTATNFPVEILFLRDDDIPQYVEQGVADAGIVGENMVSEKGRDIRIIEKLGFARCRLSLAIPKDEDYPGLHFFNGKKIATSYPRLLSDFLKKNNLKSEIEEISGSVEIAPGIGLADAVCDIVSSGSTLLTNGLKEVATIMDSQAILVANKNLDEKKLNILNKLVFRINAVKNAKENKYILLNAPEDAVERI
ncbi:MAG: ATP phosphoribosyltransferase, partial [Bacteroidales bacterium]|nr:ATP phosphoribosyltransferase [Bacteroidales bacterium]